MRLNPALERLGSYPIAEVQNIARQMRDAGERLIDFSIGDPREPTPAFIPEALRAAVPEVSQYPTVAGLAILRSAVADYLQRRFGVEVDPETQVIPTSGSKEAIFSSHLAFVTPGESVIFPTPGYPIYERGAVFAGAEPIGVPLDGDFVFRPSDVPQEVFAEARAAWICNPHNPTGSLTSMRDLEAWVDACRSSDTLLLSDECYVDVYEGEAPDSTLQVAGEGAAGVLAFFSLSKRSGMTGYRSGAIVGDPAGIAALKQLRSSVGVAPPEFVQEAAAAAWADDDHAAHRREIFRAKRDVLRPALEDMGCEVVGSTAGIYVWAKVDDDIAATKRLLEEGVVVSPGSAFGRGGEGFIRLALVPSVQECQDAVEVLRRCLTEK